MPSQKEPGASPQKIHQIGGPFSPIPLFSMLPNTSASGVNGRRPRRACVRRVQPLWPWNPLAPANWRQG